jgi:hypothetical protein
MFPRCEVHNYFTKGKHAFLNNMLRPSVLELAKGHVYLLIEETVRVGFGHSSNLIEPLFVMDPKCKRVLLLLPPT